MTAAGRPREPPEHKKFIEDLKAFTKAKYASGWSIVGYQSIYALDDCIKKAGHQFGCGGEGVAGNDLRHAGRETHLQRQIPRDLRTGILGVMVKEAAYSFAVPEIPYPTLDWVGAILS